jgi:enoyl-CoA hydratase
MPFTLALASRVPANAAVGEMLGLYARGEDLATAAALAAETAHSVGRSYDLEAFTAAGNALAVRQREGPAANSEGST